MANNVKVNLKNVRCAFLYVFKKKEPNPAYENQAAAYRATFILDKDDPQLEALEDAAFEACTEAFGSEAAAEKWMKRHYAQMSPKECGVCDGDERDEPSPEFDGTIYISAKNSKRQPTIMTDAGEFQTQEGVTKDGFEIEGNQVYSGCMVNASIEFWAYDSTKGKGLSVTLLGLKFVEDNEAFGGVGGSVATEDDLGGSSSSRKSSKSRRGNDDDKQSSRKRTSRRDDDEDEEDNRSSRRRRASEDDEDEDRGSRRKSSRRNDDDDEDDERSSRRRRR